MEILFTRPKLKRLRVLNQPSSYKRIIKKINKKKYAFNFSRRINRVGQNDVKKNVPYFLVNIMER